MPTLNAFAAAPINVSRAASTFIDSGAVQLLAVHPYAESIPAMNAAAFDRLSLSILTDGQLSPVVMFQGKVLDGRHRLVVAQQQGLGLWVTEFTGSERDAMTLAIKANVQRRQLTDSQRALAAAKKVTTTLGGQQAFGAVSQAQAAEMFDVSL